MYRNQPETLAVLGRIPTLADRIDDDPACDLAVWRATIKGRENRSEQVNHLTGAQARAMIAAHTPDESAALLTAIRDDAGARLLQRLDPASAAAALNPLPLSAAGRILRRMGGRRTGVLDAVGEPRRTHLSALLSYPDESVGSNMTPSILALPGTDTAHQAVEVVRGTGPHTDSARYVHVLGLEGELVGVTSLREVMLSSPDTELIALAPDEVISVDARADQEVLVDLFAEHPYASIPVVDDGVLVGVVPAERAGEIQAAETTEDFRRMAALGGGLTMSLRDAGIWALYRSRVGWLVILVFGNVFSGAGIAHYEDLIASAMALVFFLPLLIDSGGNAGSQSATLMVRALATGDVRMRDWSRLLGKELTVALLLGLTMAAAVSILGVARGGAEVALVVSLSMVLIVVVGAVIGMSLPFLLTRMKLDPASASAPLITSICDGVGVLIYFFIASQFLL